MGTRIYTVRRRNPGEGERMTYEELLAENDRLLKEIEVLKADITFWRRQYDDAKKWYLSVTGKGAWE